MCLVWGLGVSSVVLLVRVVWVEFNFQGTVSCHLSAVWAALWLWRTECETAWFWWMGCDVRVGGARPCPSVPVRARLPSVLGVVLAPGPLGVVCGCLVARMLLSRVCWADARR